jgi:hypothetical protein
VFAFADGQGPSTFDEYFKADYNSYKKGEVSPYNSRWALLELFSNTMSNSDTNKMIELLLCGRIWGEIPLNGTPLTESLLYMYTYLSGFRKENNVEKLSFITVTDGQGARFGGSFRNYDRINGKNITKRYFIKTSNKKVIEFFDDPATQASAVLDAIRDRYDCKSIGFYIGSNTGSGINEFIRCNYGYDFYHDQQKYAEVRNVIRDETRKDGIALLKSAPGRDMMFFTPQAKLKTFDGELSINVNDNAKKIAKEFSKHLTKKKVSRILLNEFVKIIA